MQYDAIDYLLAALIIGGIFALIKFGGFLWEKLTITDQEREARRLLPSLGLNEGCKDAIIRACRAKKDVLPYLQRGYSREQLEEIIMGWKNDVDITRFSDIKLPASEMQHIRYALEDEKRKMK